MRIESFEPTEYTSPCGTIRARKVGILWEAEVLQTQDLGHRWQHHAYGHTAQEAIGAVLEELGLADDHDPVPTHYPDPEDELRW